MSGRSIFAHVDPDTAARPRLVSTREGQTASQVTAAALRFYLSLQAAAHTGLRELEAFSTPEERHNLVRAIARVIAGTDFEISRRRAVAGMQVDNEDRLQTDDISWRRRLGSPERADAGWPGTDDPTLPGSECLGRRFPGRDSGPASFPACSPRSSCEASSRRPNGHSL
jgi:hypothetical protein